MLETKRNSYQPLLRVAIAVSLGIVVDRMFGVPISAWLILLGLMAASWLILFRSRRITTASVSLLLAVSALGAAWHNLHWNWWSVPDVVSFASEQKRSVVLRGTVCSQPRWGPATFQFRRDGETSYRTRFDLKVNAVRDRNHFKVAAGVLQVFVSDRNDKLRVGDQIELVGSLSKVPTTSNPGSFDFREHFRGQRILCWLTIDHSNAIQFIQNQSTTRSFVSGLRKRMDDLIWQYMDEDRAALASAMLLGNRNQLDRLKRDEFMLSGTIHLLAISGLHVGILASFFFLLPRLGLAPRRLSLIMTVVFVFTYAWIVEFRPPVLRAAILITVFCYCRWAGRQPFSFNSLALAALIVLIVNPADLFRVGAQLSFLAVGSMVFASHWFFRVASEDPIDRLLVKSRSLPERLRDGTLRRIGLAFAVSGIIWLVAMPLVAARFNVVAPIALLVNPVLLIPVTISLFCGLAVIVFGGWLAPVASLFAAGCDSGIWMIQTTVEGCQQFPGGHFWSSGPINWALFAFYSILLLAFLRFQGLAFRYFAIGFVVWLMAGWFVPDWVAQKEARRRTTTICTIGDVGHGGFVLFELPRGKNLVYDCGCFGSPRRAQQVAAGILWENRIKKIDTLVISHADSDHFNGIPFLAKQFSIERVVVSDCMLEKAKDSKSVRALFSQLRLAGVQLDTVTVGDELAIGEEVKARVLNPSKTGNSDSDNGDSVVLELEINSVRFLMPGDIEGEALDRLLESQIEPFDVVMAPHHGSRNSRPAEFVEWCQPRYVVVSSRRGRSSTWNQMLESTNSMSSLRPVEILHTGFNGAVQFQVGSSGQVSCRVWSQHPW